jgi:hypothetical protein
VTSSPAATTLNCASLFWRYLRWFQLSFPRPTRGFLSIGRVDYIVVVVVALITIILENIIIENTIIRRQKGKLQRQVEVDAGVRVANCTSVCCMVGIEVVKRLGVQLGTLFKGADNNCTSMRTWNACCSPDSTAATVLRNVDKVFDRNPSCWLGTSNFIF